MAMVFLQVWLSLGLQWLYRDYHCFPSRLDKNVKLVKLTQKSYYYHYSCSWENIPSLGDGQNLIGLMVRKYFLWTWFAVLAWFWPFVSKKCQNMEKKSSYQTENPYLDSPHTKNPMFTNFFLLSENKVLAPEQHCTNIVSVMWPESIELVFLGFILMV